MNSRFTEEQIIKIRKESLSGVKVQDLVREHGISEQTYNRWKSKHGGMEVLEARRLKTIEEKNRRLKKLVPEKEPHIEALKEVLEKKW